MNRKSKITIAGLCAVVVAIVAIWIMRPSPTIESRELVISPNSKQVLTVELRVYGDRWFTRVPVYQVWLGDSPEGPHRTLLFSVSDLQSAAVRARWLDGGKVLISYPAGDEVLTQAASANGVLVEYEKSPATP